MPRLGMAADAAWGWVTQQKLCHQKRLLWSDFFGEPLGQHISLTVRLWSRNAKAFRSTVRGEAPLMSYLRSSSNEDTEGIDGEDADESPALGVESFTKRFLW